MSDQNSDSNNEFILVVEDSIPNRNILAHIVKQFGIQVVEAADGKEAWEILEKWDKSKKLVAIFSDIMMPNMNGIQLLEKLRSHAQYGKIPFTLFTAVSDKDYIIKAKELNVNGYILKPVSFKKIEKKMTELFPSRAFPKIAS